MLGKEMSNSREEGWLQLKVGEMGNWDRMYITFESGIFLYSPMILETTGSDLDLFDNGTKFLMDQVISLRTDDQYGDSTIQIATTEHKLYLRATSKEEMRKWLVCFQKSVALVLSKLLLSSSHSYPDTKMAIAQYNHEHQSQNRQVCSEDGSHTPYKAREILRGNVEKSVPINEILRHHSERGNHNTYAYGGEDRHKWARELGDGHGKSSSLLNRRAIASSRDGGGGTICGRPSSESIPLSEWDKSDSIRGSYRGEETSGYNSSGKSSNCEVGSCTVTISTQQAPPHTSTFPNAWIQSDDTASRPHGQWRGLKSSTSESPHSHDVREKDYVCDIRVARSHSVGQSSDGGEERGYDFYKYGDITDDDSCLSGSEGGTMNDCEDFDSISRCGSNIGVKRINLTQTRNCSPRNAVSGSGMDCVDETPMRLQKIFDIPQLRSQECERHQQKTQSQRSKYGTSEIRWSTGFCSRLGPRNSNEDRFVVLPDLLETVGCSKSMNEESISNPATNGHTDGKTRASTTSTVSEKSQDMCNISIVENCDHIAEGAKERHGYFAVYDGHCGGQAATYLEETLHVSIFNHPLYHTDLQTAIIETCVCTDKTFLAESREKQQYSGSTALGAFIRGRELVVFNLGDCHAVVSCSGVAVDMSEAHKPNRSDERERIMSANGWITEEKELYMARLHRMDLSDPLVRDKAQQVSWVTIYRVCGEISVSRSIGDPDYKSYIPGAKVDAFFIWPEGHDQAFAADLLISVPEVRTLNLTAEHEFLIIASDGLWDVISSNEAVTTARCALNAGKTACEVSEDLCDLALKLGSSDNVTVVIVQFVFGLPLLG